MISISLKNNTHSRILPALFLALLFVGAPHVRAQSGGLSLSVTPTLFQMSAVPGQTWSSGVKVINNNPHELTVYGQVVNFAPQGESGEGKFIPVLKQATEGTTLAEWITLKEESITIAPEESVTIPFLVEVPKDAAPGGHFAAILVGTKPPQPEGQVKVSTSQIVTSLFFVRIAGDVEEVGSIREFRSVNHFTNTPKADFEVRFENKGNVHLQPQGEIVITNMWGKERGVIPINHQTHFGNVLPLSIRKFEFSWRGETSFSDIGRYKAVLSLSYGTNEKKFETATEHFYVVPVKATLIFLATVGALIFLIRLSINAYIRRMLLLSGIDPYERNQRSLSRYVKEGDVRIMKKTVSEEMVTSNTFDFIKSLRGNTQFYEKCAMFFRYIAQHKMFYARVLAIGSLVLILIFFVTTSLTDKRDYEVVITNPDTAVVLSSEEIMYAENQPEVRTTSDSETIKNEQAFELKLINSSNVPGAAAKLQPSLEALGYSVTDLQSDFGEIKERSVIVYSPELAEIALELSKAVSGALLSADSHATATPHIHVYIGND